MKSVAIIAFSMLLLTGCSTASTQSETGSVETTVEEKKAPNTTLTGTVTKTGTRFYLTAVGKAPTELDSYTVKLDELVGKEISVTGQYSGTTLFVDSVQ